MLDSVENSQCAGQRTRQSKCPWTQQASQKIARRAHKLRVGSSKACKNVYIIRRICKLFAIPSAPAFEQCFCGIRNADLQTPIHCQQNFHAGLPDPKGYKFYKLRVNNSCKMSKCFKDFYFIGLSLGLWIKIALKITEVVLNCFYLYRNCSKFNFNCLILDY